MRTFSRADVASHNHARSCYVTIGSKVYDITSFLEDHPGGPELILEYGGKDITEILQDPVSHEHSDSAYEILEENQIGVISSAGKAGPGTVKDENSKEAVYATTGMAREEDLSMETDFAADYKKHHFLDLSRPLFPQLWFGGFSKEFYLDQVHRPRHYTGGDSAPLFGNFLEPLSKTPWWVIPSIWLPCVAYGTYVAASGLSTSPESVGYFLAGVFVWSLVEYGLHRCLFHVDKYLPNNRVGITLHFLLHGIHHYLPMDRYRLVMPPTLFVVLASPFYKLAHAVFFYNWYAAVMVYCGGIFGYICYDMTHYFLHHRNLPYYYRQLKKYHLQHHFADYDNGFGVTSRFWDKVFGTELQCPPPKATKMS